MEILTQKLLRRILKLLEKIEWKLDNPPQQLPNTPPSEGQANVEPKNVPFLVSNRPEVSLAPELITQWQQNQQQGSAYHRRSIRVQWALFWATVAAFVAASVYAYIAGDTFTEIRSQADSAASQVAIMQRQFRIDERAWIEINSIKLEDTMMLPPGRPERKMFRYSLTLKNFGKTVARDVLVKHILVGNSLGWGSDTRAIRRIQESLINQKTATPALPKVVAPGIETMSFKLQVTAARRNFYDANAFSYVVGRIDYRDAFHEPHWIGFCFVVNVAENFVYCQGGNDEDNDPE